MFSHGRLHTAGYTGLTLESDISTGNSGEYITATLARPAGLAAAARPGETLLTSPIRDSQTGRSSQTKEGWPVHPGPPGAPTQPAEEAAARACRITLE